MSRHREANSHSITFRATPSIYKQIEQEAMKLTNELRELAGEGCREITLSDVVRFAVERYFENVSSKKTS